MKTTIWGPYAWNLYHSIPLYLQLQKRPFPEAEEWVNLWKNILPCSTCQTHYINYLDAYQPSELNLSDPYNLTQWTINIHNHVNASIGKEKWTQSQIYAYYGYPEELRFWSRNLLIFIYLCLHSPFVNWTSLTRFVKLITPYVPLISDEESKIWNDMIEQIPAEHSESFAWFEEFKPRWTKQWSGKWPAALVKSTYLKKLRWIMTKPNRPPLPAIGAFIPII